MEKASVSGTGNGGSSPPRGNPFTPHFRSKVAFFSGLSRRFHRPVHFFLVSEHNSLVYGNTRPVHPTFIGGGTFSIMKGGKEWAPTQTLEAHLVGRARTPAAHVYSWVRETVPLKSEEANERRLCSLLCDGALEGGGGGH